MITASLDMGTEQMVLALATTTGDACQLVGIKRVGSQGVENGLVKDAAKAGACIHALFSKLVGERTVDVLNVALAGDAVRITECKVTVPLMRQVVEKADLVQAERRCRKELESDSRELVDLVPVSYSVDGQPGIADPLGQEGEKLQVTYQAYWANVHYLDGVHRLFDDCEVGQIRFYPVAHAYTEAFRDAGTPDVALVDIGAGSINVVLFRDNMLEYEARLPLGADTIDLDIMKAFGVDAVQARELKHTEGQALRANCKNRKVVIPGTRSTLESRDLATVVQSRAEELLEGVVCLLQKWNNGGDDLPIWLVGGGSRLKDLALLLNRYTGSSVTSPQVTRIRAEGKVPGTPEYAVALGLLLCAPPAEEKPQGSLKNTVGTVFKKIFGI